ncbi:hypothetical protein CH75_04825 [Dyella jiangningensis]|nr:hypothetical protein CH75_04825 [Dyella jiangningensis]
MSIIDKTVLVPCYDVRGHDTETSLIGPITERIIDADRFVRCEFQNGMPNWMLYRTALAGDSLYLPKLRQWVIAFTLVYAMDGGVKREAITDELIGCAALDALSMLVYLRPLQGYRITAEAIGTNHKTYWRLREAVYKRMKASLDEYWIRMLAAYWQVALVERKMTRKS